MAHKAKFSAGKYVRAGLTEDEILKISFESPHVKRSISVGQDGKAETLLFEYER